jgi:hypothetical protein
MERRRKIDEDNEKNKTEGRWKEGEEEEEEGRHERRVCRRRTMIRLKGR